MNAATLAQHLAPICRYHHWFTVVGQNVWEVMWDVEFQQGRVSQEDCLDNRIQTNRDSAEERRDTFRIHCNVARRWRNGGTFQGMCGWEAPPEVQDFIRRLQDSFAAWRDGRVQHFNPAQFECARPETPRWRGSLG